MKPIRLTRGPISGSTFAVRQYREREDGVIVTGTGQYARTDVSAEYDALFLTDLLGDPECSVLGALADAAEGRRLDQENRDDLKAMNNRIVAIVERHNARVEADRG